MSSTEVPIQESQEINENYCPQDCLLNVLELCWPMNNDLTTTILKNWLEIAAMKCVQLQNLQDKRHLKVFLQGIQQIQKRQKKDKISLQDKISFDDFKEVLKVTDLFTTWCQTSIESRLKDILIEVFQKNFLEDCSGPSSIPTTSMSSTTVPFPQDIVDVPELQNCLSNEPVESILDTITFQEDISSISQNICVNRQENFCILRTPGEKGQYLVKLEMYPVSTISSIEKNQWWRQAMIRMNFLTASKVDPLHILCEKVIASATKRITQVKDVKKEIRKKSYWSGYNSSRVAPY